MNYLMKLNGLNLRLALLELYLLSWKDVELALCDGHDDVGELEELAELEFANYYY